MGEEASQPIGSVGTVTESYAAGVASAAASVNLPTTNFGLSFTLSAQANLDAKVLISFLAAKIGGPIPTEVATFLEAALAAT